MTDAPLETLIERSRRGDLDAFSDVVRRLHGEVRGFAAMLAVASDWIDDVAQEVFIEAYRALGRYDAALPFEKWLRGIARNVIRRHGERQSRDSKLRQDSVSVWLRRRADPREEPADTRLGALRRCVERLPDHLRRVVDLHYRECKTSAAIAQTLQRSAEAVRMSLVRIRAALLQCIEAETRKAEA